MAALWLAALCPFTANYVAMPLTETPSIFCVALGLCAFAAVLERPRWGWMLALAFAWSYAALLRPDGALLALVFFPALIFYGRNSIGFARSLRIALFCGLVSVLPFAAWTLRNWHTFHVFQPLAPRSATDPGEPKALGFQRWTKTWMADFASTYEIYWNVPGDDIDIHLLPARALDEDTRQTLDLIAQYNAGDLLTPQIDAGFAALAAARIRAHPFRYYVTLAPAAPGGYVAPAPGGDAQYRTALVAIRSAPRGDPHRLCVRSAEPGLFVGGPGRSRFTGRGLPPRWWPMSWCAACCFPLSRRLSLATRWNVSPWSLRLPRSPSTVSSAVSRGMTNGQPASSLSLL